MNLSLDSTNGSKADAGVPSYSSKSRIGFENGRILLGQSVTVNSLVKGLIEPQFY
jgi:hypothetical protein